MHVIQAQSWRLTHVIPREPRRLRNLFSDVEHRVKGSTWSSDVKGAKSEHFSSTTRYMCARSRHADSPGLNSIVLKCWWRSSFAARPRRADPATSSRRLRHDGQWLFVGLKFVALQADNILASIQVTLVVDKVRLRAFLGLQHQIPAELI